MPARPRPAPARNPAKEFLRETFRSHTMAHWEKEFADVDAAFAGVKNLREADDVPIRHRRMIARGRRVIGNTSACR
ncbi:MAG: hypothetical protein IPG43_24425 [Proteobacteria bacterium]|nr:hypothetical protein [Pseudomonadota bacterium]